MTIQEWNLVINAAMLALMVGGAFWFKYVVDQQLKTKDAAIQALEGVIKVKDAHIASLEGNTAPAITRAYADMRDHANKVTEESQRLAVQLDVLTKRQETEHKSLEANIVIGEAEGLSRAFDLLEEHVWKIIRPYGGSLNPRLTSEDLALLLDGIMVTAENINGEIRKRLNRGESLLAA